MSCDERILFKFCTNTVLCSCIKCVCILRRSKRRFQLPVYCCEFHEQRYGILFIYQTVLNSLVLSYMIVLFNFVHKMVPQKKRVIELLANGPISLNKNSFYESVNNRHCWSCWFSYFKKILKHTAIIRIYLKCCRIVYALSLLWKYKEIINEFNLGILLPWPFSGIKKPSDISLLMCFK